MSKADEADNLELGYSREKLQRDLLRGMITEPLLSHVKSAPEEIYHIIIAMSEFFPEGTEAARELVEAVLRELDPPVRIGPRAANYIFASLTGFQILHLAKLYRSWIKDQGERIKAPIYRVWEDQQINACITKSISTVKVDACHRAFSSLGKDILWGVIDSGIDSNHVHFAEGTIEGTLSKDFCDPLGNGLHDPFGHGTHVAGIIAGHWTPAAPQKVIASQVLVEESDGTGDEQTDVRLEELVSISGMAPCAKLVSFRVLDEKGGGRTSAVLQAIEEVQRINKNGRWLRIHGVNMSIGYDFNPRWFGCGQSPLCVEVDRLVRSGVVVVVAAGNSGFSSINRTESGTNELGYRGNSINDPGNAELAITVGSTHREMPHTYGVSFFSSRGPTGDGRLKPDLVAPGEHIISCASGAVAASVTKKLPAGSQVLYTDQSGTSEAAPHVSGAVAAFLSVRREFIGQPEKVKRLFLDNAISLNREREFQGHGMLDVLKVLQAV